jgi:hypothetical protein
MKKVAILGKLETKYNAPFDDHTWDIWATGRHSDRDLLPRITQWFDLHKKPVNTDKGTILRHEFPFKICEDLVSGRYFCSTMSYLIAYAVFLGYDEISIYGARFEYDHEHRAKEKQNVRELLLFAKGAGVKIFDYDGIVTQEFPNMDTMSGDFDNDFDTDFDTI